MCLSVHKKWKFTMRISAFVRMECIELMEFVSSVSKGRDTITMPKCVSPFAPCSPASRITDVSAKMGTISSMGNARPVPPTKSMTKGGRPVSSPAEKTNTTMESSVNAYMDSTS